MASELGSLKLRRRLAVFAWLSAGVVLVLGLAVTLRSIAGLDEDNELYSEGVWLATVVFGGMTLVGTAVFVGVALWLDPARRQSQTGFLIAVAMASFGLGVLVIHDAWSLAAFAVAGGSILLLYSRVRQPLLRLLLMASLITVVVLAGVGAACVDQPWTV
jgi:hypothetical protein